MRFVLKKDFGIGYSDYREYMYKTRLLWYK